MFAKMWLLEALAAILVYAVFLTNPAPAQQPVPPGIEIQTRGPVHEAFAQPFNPKPQPGPAVPKEPPAALPEQAPEQRPEGDVQWIGGYWAWDAEGGDFVWISGTYRHAPPGRQFVPGHWVNMPDGWRWVPGFWAPDSQTEIPYADQPPAPLDTQPSLPPPDENSTYIPGYWSYQNSTYAWRPGFYTAMRPGRIWIAPSYLWTPAGYIFVPGYWDYPLENRGLLFAPVWFSRPLWQTPGWSCQPSHVVGADALLDSLFTWNQQYYFGNYYTPAYARLGFQPWFGCGNDPLFGYYRWAYRADPSWAAGVQRVFNDRLAGRAAAPPQTFAQQSAANRVVAPLSQQAHLTRVTPAQAANQQTTNRRANQLAQQRSQQEKVGALGNANHSLRLPPVAPTSRVATSAAISNKGPVVTAAPTGKPDLRSLRTGDAATGNTARGQPRVIPPTPSGVPHVLPNMAKGPGAATAHTAPVKAGNSVGMSVHSARPANIAAPTPRATVPQARAQTPAPHHVAPTTAHAGRTVNHSAPARSGGGGHRGGHR